MKTNVFGSRLMILLAANGAAALGAAATETIVNVGPRRELFVDLHLIDQMKNARLTLS